MGCWPDNNLAQREPATMLFDGKVIASPYVRDYS